MSSEVKHLERTIAAKDEAFSELLRIKDEITTKLLEETKKSADLAQIQSFVEEQLRDTFERTLQNVRTEFVKKRRKLIPGVKQLEVAVAGLSKAERNLQQYPRKSNSEIKRSKRRIQNAKQVLMECTSVTSELYSNLQRCVCDEISVLREKLVDIPESMHKSLMKLQSNRTEKDKLSDSDSDMSLDGSLLLSKEVTMNRKAFKTENRGIDSNTNIQNENTRNETASFQRNKSKTALNGVDLFTSDSDSIEEKFDTGTYQPIGPFQMSQDIDPKRDDIKKVPSIYHHVINERHDHQQQDTTLTRKTNRLSRRDQAEVTPSPRSSQKRILPSLPAKPFSDQIPNMSKRSTDKKLNRTPVETQRFSGTSVRGSAGFKTTDMDESLDMEEIEFKETVKNTRQQIIDKLKSKCTVSPTYKFMTSTVDLDDTATLLEPCSSIFSESFNSTLTSIKDSGVDLKESSLKAEERNEFKGKDHYLSGSERETYSNGYTSTAVDNSNIHNSSFVGSYKKKIRSHKMNGEENRPNDHPVYNWKRVEIFKRNNKTDQNDISTKSNPTDSKVSIAIRKFETVGNELSTNCRESRRQFRSRSATGPRMKYDNSLINNKALQPRMKVENTTGNNWSNNNDSLCSNGDMSMNSLRDYSTSEVSICSTSKVNTESNLKEICSSRSRKNIREAWRHRRSASMAPRVSVQRLKTGPVYEYVTSFTLPNHGSKCHISGIVVLSNGFVVILDETHCYLVLFDSNRNYLSQYNIMDVPSGITSVCSRSFAISYPFRSKIGVFKEHSGNIVSENIITVPCKEWLTDVGFQQNTYYALCKGGHIHVLDQSGSEVKRIIVGVNGKIALNQSAKRIYVTGTGQVTRFDSDGNELSRRTNLNTFNVIFVGETVYIGDREKHKIVSLSEHSDINDLIPDKIDFPSAICVHRGFLFASSFQETLDVESTRRVRVYKLRKSE